MEAAAKLYVGFRSTSTTSSVQDKSTKKDQEQKIMDLNYICIMDNG